MKQPKEVIKEWIEAVLTEGKRLTAWEIHFIESITEQFNRSGSLSDKQEEILERIYCDKVP